MEVIIAQTVALLALAMVVAIVARRLKLPYTVGLVLTGLALALSRLNLRLDVIHDVVFDLILPPLLFEASLNLRWRELRRDAAPILALATVGVLLGAGAVAAGLIYGLGWPLRPALAFGALIAATDPTAVIALLRETGIKGRLALLIESESLANDGSAAVLFSLALTVGADAALPGPGAALASFAAIAGGAILIGAAAAGIALAIVGRTDDHLVETAITAVAAYGAFLAAEHFGASGVLATVTAGLLLGNLGVLAAPAQALSLSPQGREFVIAFWEFAAFLANSFVFLLIGISLSHLRFGLDVSTLAIVALALAGRAVAVYPVAAAFARSRWRIGLAEQHFLWWGGLRGALALALVLSLGPEEPYRREIVIGAFAVVAFSTLVQGLTAGWVLQRLRIA